MRSWLIALLATLALTTSAVAETVTFRSATWPPTPLQQRLAKTAGQTLAEQASTTIKGELYLPAGNGPFPAVVLMPPCTGRLPIKLERADGERYTALGYALLAMSFTLAWSGFHFYLAGRTLEADFTRARQAAAERI